MEERVENIGKEVNKMGGRIDGLQKALYTAALSVAGAAIVFAATIFTVFD